LLYISRDDIILLGIQAKIEAKFKMSEPTLLTKRQLLRYDLKNKKIK